MSLLLSGGNSIFSSTNQYPFLEAGKFEPANHVAWNDRQTKRKQVTKPFKTLPAPELPRADEPRARELHTAPRLHTLLQTARSTPKQLAVTGSCDSVVLSVDSLLRR